MHVVYRAAGGPGNPFHFGRGGSRCDPSPCDRVPSLLALTPCSLDNSISIAAALKRTSVAVDARLSLLRKRALDTANSDKTKDAVLHRRDVGARHRSIIGMRNDVALRIRPANRDNHGRARPQRAQSRVRFFEAEFSQHHLLPNDFGLTQGACKKLDR
jgi:hypothetical protein